MLSKPSSKQYWFPAKPPGYGWGWGLPRVWQGWMVLAAFFVLLIGGMIVLTPHGPLISVGYACLLAGLLVVIGLWKGEPPGRGKP